MRSRPATLLRPVPLLAGLTAAGLLLAGCGSKALPSGGEPSSVSASAAETATGAASGRAETAPLAEQGERIGAAEAASEPGQAPSPASGAAAGTAGRDASGGPGQERGSGEAGNAPAASTGKANQVPADRAAEAPAAQDGAGLSSGKPSGGASPAADQAPGTAYPAASPDAERRQQTPAQGSKPPAGAPASGSKPAAGASPAPSASAGPPASSGPRASLPVSSASPSPSPAGSAPPTVRSSLDGPETIRFSELYGKETVRGLTFSDKLKELDGQKVEMIGYMAPPLTATVRFFVLTRIPLAICPFCSSDADWPSDIVVVNLPKGSEMTPTEHQVKITGTLSVGSMTDEETGFVSLIRINADKTEVLK
ncbi:MULTISPECIES: hypothetical protein [unclassified Paenibacillus]|uniref:hypothetical protein n=1 Tax=unclassified Paenibacillus TaxID=185978 RepID=UPI000955D8F4|nr:MULTISPECIES: hypothetical protein [unclassified Paenibacillus]SIR60029.1 hypothetical protein SAMN05880555_4379 [Paenibacillus sp. RU4X]SIR68874.1 hypothetical protein SAMN05880570_4381 [Paenibacillus sp. RU4T]